MKSINSAIILNFNGKILSCPPIVNSPKGKPKISRTVNMLIIENKIAAIRANITKPPYIIIPFTEESCQQEHLLA